MKKNILTAAVIAIGIIFVTIPVQAADPTITAEVPQTITMTGEGFNKSGTPEGIWTVTSNDGFDVSFSGTSQDDIGSALSYPPVQQTGCGRVMVFCFKQLDYHLGILNNQYYLLFRQ